MPVETPAVAPATRVQIVFKGVPQWVLARSVVCFRENEQESHRVFFRIENSAEEIFSTVSSNWHETKRSPEHSSPWISLKTRIGVYRYWHAPNAPFALRLGSGGSGEALFGVDKGGPRSSFYWKRIEDKSDFLDWNARQLNEFCQQLVLNSDSELNFW